MTLDDVAALSRVTRPAIYNYFPSKQALAQAVLLESQASMDQIWQEAAASEPTLPGKLRAILRASLNAAFGNPASTLGFVGVARAAHTDPEMAKLFRDRSTVLRKFVRELVADAIRSGELSEDADQRDIIEAMSGMIWAISAGAAEAPDGRIRDQIARGIDHLFRSDL